VNASTRRLPTALSALLALAVLAPATSADVADHPRLGEPAPSFELPSVDGDTFRLADHAGDYLVIHFGASW